jgi:CDP-diacylglycerol--serine O-phosphatidyltransferase
MNEKKYFIISLNWADWLTLSSLLLSSLGLLSALHATLALAIGLMLLAMFVDMLDGPIARYMKLESEFGRYFDSFCDVFTYLILPMFILYQFGMQDTLSIFALFIFLVCGMLRLSHFNLTGVIEDRGVAYHLGLQVIWSHLLVVCAFPLWMWLGKAVRYPLILILLVMSLFMIRSLRFPKPTHYTFQAIVILLVTLIYFYLHFIGIDAP